jgi:hypothetical protein
MPVEMKMDGALAEAAATLAEGRLDACLSALETAVKATSAAQNKRIHGQIHAACRVHLATRDGSWRQLLGLEDKSVVSSQDVKRQFRRLASLVHPDKCALPGASQTFQLLQSGVEDLLARASPPIKRQKRRGGGGKEGADSQGDDSSSKNSDDEGPENGGFPWWSRWEPHSGLKTAARAPHTEASAPSDVEEDFAAIDQLPEGDLRDEVARRQQAVFEGATGFDGRPLPIARLQARLLRARTKLQEQLASSGSGESCDPGAYGGFLRE